jgi:hypothetical protein
MIPGFAQTSFALSTPAPDSKKAVVTVIFNLEGLGPRFGVKGLASLPDHQCIVH